MTQHELAVGFASLADSGWIGRWSPEIGDPTLMGWFTVVLYALAGWRCYRLAKDGPGLHADERIIWRILAIGLFALGVNKQLDLQSALTEFGRILAKQQGWYETRREVQAKFIYGVIGCAAFAGLALALLARNAPVATWTSVVGGMFILGFVVVRAASFHHVDRMIGSYCLGLKVNWLFELGGLGIVLFGARRRLLSG